MFLSVVTIFTFGTHRRALFKDIVLLLFFMIFIWERPVLKDNNENLKREITLNEKNYVLLTSASKEMCELSQQRLLKAGIKSKIEDYSQNAYFSPYGGSSMMGVKLIVLG